MKRSLRWLLVSSSIFIAVCDASAQLRILSPSPGVRLTPGALAKIVWKSPGPGWKYDISASWNGGPPVVIAQDLVDASYMWQVPGLTADTVTVNVVGHGERGMIYGPLMHSASLHYFLRTDQNRYLCLGYSPVATQWSELMERSYRSIVFQGVVRDNMNPYESAVSGNGRFVAAIDTLGMIRFYDMEYESQYGVPLYRSTLARMYGVAQQISSSGKYFMFTTRQSGVRDSVGCYDIEAGDVIWKISNGDTIDEIATHPTMPWLVVREHAGNRSKSVILDERTGSTVATIQDAKVLGWVGRGRVAMIEQDTSYVFRDVTAGTDLPLRFATNGGIRTPVLTADGKHVVVGWIRHTDSASYQKVLRYDLVSGLAIDSIEFVGDHLDRLDCADDGSVVVASDEKAYVYLKFGTAPVYRTWGTEGFGWILFDSKLGLLRVSRSSGSTTYDLASGTPVYDRPLGGFLDADRVVRIPTQKRYMMFSSIPKRSFYVCEYEHSRAILVSCRRQLWLRRKKLSLDRWHAS